MSKQRLGIWVSCSVCGNQVLKRRWQISKSKNKYFLCENSCRFTPEILFERFVVKSEDPDSCWGWSGSTVKGYGWMSTSYNGKPVHTQAHRFSYEKYKGKIPKGLLVRHLCNNPPCCNPGHLELGVHKDNYDDMVKAGRDNKFSKIDKLTADHVKVWINFNIMPLTEIASYFEISLDIVYGIAVGRRWKKTNIELTHTKKEKLCDLTIEHIKYLLKNTGFTKTQIGDHFGVKCYTIGRIASGMYYKSVGN